MSMLIGEKELDATDTIIYEQPLNEQMRLCLRLEHLFNQIAHHINQETSWDASVVVTALFEVLNVLDRPDLKNKLGQTLMQYIGVLSQLENLPDIDNQKLQTMINQLNNAMDLLHSIPGKIGQALLENEFLLPIQQRLIIPAGTCGFSIPAYSLWLRQPSQAIIKHLQTWFEPFKPLQQIVSLLLQITRDSVDLKMRNAKAGFYQANLDSSVPYQIIRIQVALKASIYPEISVGLHRLSLHFFELNSQGKANQTKKDVDFALACCKLYTKDYHNSASISSK